MSERLPLVLFKWAIFLSIVTLGLIFARNGYGMNIGQAFVLGAALGLMVAPIMNR